LGPQLHQEHIVAQLLLLQSQHRQVVWHHIGAPLKRSIFILLVDRGNVSFSAKENAASASVTMKRKRVVRYRIRGCVDIRERCGVQAFAGFVRKARGGLI
jgi:hypothetical protein